MKKKTIAGLIAIAAIALVVMFSGCTESKTPIHDILENPDKYVDKEVTITAYTSLPAPPLLPYIEGEGFGIYDIEKYKGYEKDIFWTDRIWFKYSGNRPQLEDFKGKWGESVDRTVRVKGVVRYAGGYKHFYIEGESWEFID